MAAKRLGLDEKVQTAWLLAFYGPVLTQKQRQALQLYCEEDMSLSEIASQMGISRQGVYDTLCRAQDQLYGLEDKLHMQRRFSRMHSGLQELRQLLNHMTGEEAQKAQTLVCELITQDEEEDHGL